MPSSLRLFSASFMALVFTAWAGLGSYTALAAPVGSPGSPRPLMELAETHKDGGVVEQGTLVQYQFTLRNRGQADLEIPQVKTSCGCSVAKWDRVVKAGQTAVIEAQMHTDTFRGPVSKHLTVISN